MIMPFFIVKWRDSHRCSCGQNTQKKRLFIRTKVSSSTRQPKMGHCFVTIEIYFIDAQNWQNSCSCRMWFRGRQTPVKCEAMEGALARQGKHLWVQQSIKNSLQLAIVKFRRNCVPWCLCVNGQNSCRGNTPFPAAVWKDALSGNSIGKEGA